MEKNEKIVDYRQKEIDMIKALDTPAGKQYFDTKEEGLDFITDRLESFTSYVNVVVRREIMIPAWRAKFDGQELREKIQKIDSDRKICHDSATDSINILNRLCSNLGLEPFAGVDTSNRRAVADFAGMWVGQMYNNGIGETMDEVAYGRSGEYRDDTRERVNSAYDRLKAEEKKMDDNQAGRDDAQPEK